MRSRTPRPLRLRARSVLVPFVAAAISLLVSSAVLAASYLRAGGTTVDPLQNVGGGDRPYSGSDVEPAAGVPNASLHEADLGYADLRRTELDLERSSGTDLSGAKPSHAWGPRFTTGAALYDINSSFGGTGFAPFAAGWALLPGPSTALLLRLGRTVLAFRASE